MQFLYTQTNLILYHDVGKAQILITFEQEFKYLNGSNLC